MSPISAALLFGYLGVVDVGRYVTTISLVAIVGALSFFAISIPVGAVILIVTARLVWRTRALTPVGR